MRGHNLGTQGLEWGVLRSFVHFAYGQGFIRALQIPSKVFQAHTGGRRGLSPLRFRFLTGAGRLDRFQIVRHVLEEVGCLAGLGHAAPLCTSAPVVNCNVALNQAPERRSRRRQYYPPPIPAPSGPWCSQAGARRNASGAVNGRPKGVGWYEHIQSFGLKLLNKLPGKRPAHA